MFAALATCVAKTTTLTPLPTFATIEEKSVSSAETDSRETLTPRAARPLAMPLASGTE